MDNFTVSRFAHGLRPILCAKRLTVKLPLIAALGGNMDNINSYYFLDCTGTIELSSLSNIASNPTGLRVVCIDNNICQHLARFEHQNNNLEAVTLNKIHDFLNQCSSSNIEIFPDVGLTELSTSRKTGKLDKFKYKSHLRAIKRSLKRHQIEVYPNPSEFKNGMKSFMGIHGLFYTHLIKIKILESRGLNRDMAFKNLDAYLQWAETIKIQTAYPSLVAYAIFGGESKARKIFKLEKEKELLQSIWAAAWDMLYLFLAQQYFPAKFGKVKMFFATNDEALSLIGSLFKLHGVIKDGGDIRRSLVELSYDFPHYENIESKIQLRNEEIISAQTQRLNGNFDPTVVIAEKAKLERELRRLQRGT